MDVIICPPGTHIPHRIGLQGPNPRSAHARDQRCKAPRSKLIIIETHSVGSSKSWVHTCPSCQESSFGASQDPSSGTEPSRPRERPKGSCTGALRRIVAFSPLARSDDLWCRLAEIGKNADLDLRANISFHQALRFANFEIGIRCG